MTVGLELPLHDEACGRLNDLPPRMREVVVRMCLGQPMKVIAVAMGIQLDTVRNHQKLACGRFKLASYDRCALTAWVLLGVRQ